MSNKFEIGDKVVKNEATWISNECDLSWGRGVGKGVIVAPPFDLECNVVDVRWPGGRCLEKIEELLPATDDKTSGGCEIINIGGHPFRFIDGMWVGNINTSYGAHEVILRGNVAEPKHDHVSAFLRFLENVDKYLKMARKRAWLKWLYRIEMIAPNDKNVVGAYMTNRLTGRPCAGLIFLDKLTNRSTGPMPDRI